MQLGRARSSPDNPAKATATGTIRHSDLGLADILAETRAEDGPGETDGPSGPLKRWPAPNRSESNHRVRLPTMTPSAMRPVVMVNGEAEIAPVHHHALTPRFETTGALHHKLAQARRDRCPGNERCNELCELISSCGLRTSGLTARNLFKRYCTRHRLRAGRTAAGPQQPVMANGSRVNLRGRPLSNTPSSGRRKECRRIPAAEERDDDRGISVAGRFRSERSAPGGPSRSRQRRLVRGGAT